jgi:RNA polymerase sigma factor (sigma-70 family)
VTARSLNGFNQLMGTVRRTALPREPAGAPDGQLLELFLLHRDEGAFAQLVRRHGPMVLGVCARVIGNAHDAEDAFQAVFLVLARRAGSIAPRDLVGNWLYGVAYRTALQARGRRLRRQTRERQVTEMPHPCAPEVVDLEALHQALDAELDRLPTKYRVPVVLCDLEGRSRKDAAKQLKIPEGTLSSRLATARTMLARRLTRHGIALSGPALAAALAQPAAAVQPALVTTAVTAARATAAGGSAAGLVSTHTLDLSEGVAKTMFLKKLKVLSVLVLGAALGGFGTRLFGMSDPAPAPVAHAAPPAAGKPPAERAQPADPEPLDGKLLLDATIQQELRLSKNQIARLQALSRDVDVKNESKQKEIADLSAQIEELRKRIAELENEVGTRFAQIETKRAQIEADRSARLGAAAPEILSAKAVERLRQIHRQQRNLFDLLADAKVQRMLTIDDEQLKKIDAILQAERAVVDYPNNPPTFSVWGNSINDRTLEGSTKSVLVVPDHRYWHPTAFHRLQPYTGSAVGSQSALVLQDYTYIDLGVNAAPLVQWNAQALQKLFNVLTSAQQQALLDWIGEPGPGTCWHVLKRTDRAPGK